MNVATTRAIKSGSCAILSAFLNSSSRYFTSTSSAFALKKRRLRCITLDLTGTLFKFRGSVADIYLKAARDENVRCPDKDNILKHFERAYFVTATCYPCFGYFVEYWRTINPNAYVKFDENDPKSKVHYVPRAERCEEWWRRVVHLTYIKAGNESVEPEAQERVFQRIWQHFGTAEAYEVFDEVIPFIKWAKEKNIIIGIISNSARRLLKDVLPKLNLVKPVDFIILSAQIGMQKPDTRIFQLIMKQRHQPLKANEILHIGDSIENDYDPAADLSMHAVLMDRFKSDKAQEYRRLGKVVHRDLNETKRWMIKHDLV